MAADPTGPTGQPPHPSSGERIDRGTRAGGRGCGGQVILVSEPSAVTPEQWEALQERPTSTDVVFLSTAPSGLSAAHEARLVKALNLKPGQWVDWHAPAPFDSVVVRG